MCLISSSVSHTPDTHLEVNVQNCCYKSHHLIVKTILKVFKLFFLVLCYYVLQYVRWATNCMQIFILPFFWKGISWRLIICLTLKSIPALHTPCCSCILTLSQLPDYEFSKINFNIRSSKWRWIDKVKIKQLQCISYIVHICSRNSLLPWEYLNRQWIISLTTL